MESIPNPGFDPSDGARLGADEAAENRALRHEDLSKHSEAGPAHAIIDFQKSGRTALPLILERSDALAHEGVPSDGHGDSPGGTMSSNATKAAISSSTPGGVDTPVGVDSSLRALISSAPPISHAGSAPPVNVDTPLRGHIVRACVRVADPRGWLRLRLLIDLVLLYAASGVALLVAVGSSGTGSEWWLAASFPLLAVTLLYARRSSDDRLNASLLETFANVVGIVSLAMMATISVVSLLGGAHLLELATWLWLFAVIYLGVTRMVLFSVRRHALRAGQLAAPTLIVGAGVIGALLARRLLEDASYGLRPVGFLDADPLPSLGHLTAPSIPVLGGPDDLAEAIQSTGARRVILAFSSERDHVLVAKVRKCEELGVDVSLIPRLYESFSDRTTLDHVGGLPLLTLRAVDPRGWQFALKHAIDREFAFLLLLLMFPLMLAIALAVRRSSPGPVLFRQRRVGRDGRDFDVLKFRTMAGSDGLSDNFELPEGCAPGGVEGRDRRTPLGRWLRDLSFDELPQLINVLRGDMSFVGPRPERPEFVERFTQDVARYEDRHRVKSGITGWAQVHGLRGQTSIADRVEWDNYYIRNWSLRLDLRIAVLTVAEILRRRG